jgi:hypothetical protein
MALLAGTGGLIIYISRKLKFKAVDLSTVQPAIHPTRTCTTIEYWEPDCAEVQSRDYLDISILSEGVASSRLTQH